MTIFSEVFEQLTGNKPLPWQSRLFSIFRHKPLHEWPTHVDLPTGLGKTSIVHLWLIALAQQLQSNTVTLPRRLIYVVNRRTVVDQATDIAEQIKEKPPLEGFDKDWFTISTLRGQFADNGKWAANPARPAIIVGTVDMIGSRLLFSGYGRGYRHRPLHAGFLAQDALLIHDEAHLEPAFQKLLNAIKDEQTRSNEFGSFHVLPLTATVRDPSPRPFTLDQADLENKLVQQRVNAAKTLTLHSLPDEKKTAESIAQLALQRAEANPESAILIFVRRVDDVKKVNDLLVKGKIRSEKILTLTGTIRGLERDKLVEKPVFLRFRPGTHKEVETGTVFLISTSAGEVGVDISADHLVCDLTTYESMAQRFGRVNRYGNNTANIDIVHPTNSKSDDEYEIRRQRTLTLLQKLNGDASPKALMTLLPTERADAFTPLPRMLDTSPIFFDTLALTTICKSLDKIEQLPGRPPVADWLHGIEEWQPPETQVAWRREVQWLTTEILADYPPDDLLDAYPLKPHELLKDQSRRVFKELAAIAERIDADHTFVWLKDDDGTQRHTLQHVIQQDENFIKDCIVILPPAAGGLTSGGMLAGAAEFDPQKNDYDVADQWRNENDLPIRKRLFDNEDAGPGMRQVLKLSLRSDDDFDLPEDAEGPLASPPGNEWRWFEQHDNEDSESSKSAEFPVAWQTHTDDVENNLKMILVGSSLPPEIAAALLVAARLHDLGKTRTLFQRVLGNPNPAEPWAKSGKNNNGIRSRYRHELGSLLDLDAHPEFKPLPDDMKDLVRHLIATHHGRARPHFPADESFDPNYTGAQVQTALAQVPFRFARLQKRYGRWGLAYLESLLRAADCAASAHPSAYVGQPEEVHA